MRSMCVATASFDGATVDGQQPPAVARDGRLVAPVANKP